MTRIKKHYRIHWVRLVTAAIIVLACIAAAGLYCSDDHGGTCMIRQAVQHDLYDTDCPIVKTALKEVGNRGGEKYWRWYGFDYHVAWCGCFVSWCGEQHGYVSEGRMPKFVYVPDGVNWFKAEGQWKDSDYTPEAGNIIFFTDNKSGIGSHVGIVGGCGSGRVYTIEGNRRNKCIKASYPLKSRKILGYGMIK